MEDFQLETWREAYYSKDAASNHFKTGVSSVFH